jgi:hypothetical protein
MNICVFLIYIYILLIPFFLAGFNKIFLRVFGDGYSTDAAYFCGFCCSIIWPISIVTYLMYILGKKI